MKKNQQRQSSLSDEQERVQLPRVGKEKRGTIINFIESAPDDYDIDSEKMIEDIQSSRRNVNRPEMFSGEEGELESNQENHMKSRDEILDEMIDHEFAEACAAEGDDSITLESVRAISAKMTTPLSETVIAERSGTDAINLLIWEKCESIERTPAKVSGAWVFKGTRVPVRALFENLASGATIDEFLVWFPGVTREQVNSVFNAVAEST